MRLAEKIIAVVMACVLSVGVLTSCGGGPSGASSGSSSTQQSESDNSQSDGSDDENKASSSGNDSDTNENTVSDAEIESARQTILNKINKARIKAGVSGFTLGDSNMNSAAQKLAEEYAAGYSSTRPDGTSSVTALKEYSVSYTSVGMRWLAGESSATTLADKLLDEYGNSYMLSAQYNRLCIGYCYSDNSEYGNYWVIIVLKDPNLSSSDSGTTDNTEDTEPVGLTVNKHTAAEIKSYIKASGAKLSDSVEYDKSPVSPTEPGVLSQSTRESALAILNNYRFIAGLSEVKLNSAWDEAQQAACLISAANGDISHYPSQPSGMSDDIYELGHAECGKSNLAAGYSTLNMSIYGYMEDSDSSNIAKVGHRRWCLNPSMGKTAFGAVTTQSGGFYSMHSFDTSKLYGECTVAWPAQVTPLEYFDSNSAWSLSTGVNVSIDEIEVTVKQTGGRTWTFTSASSDGEFYVSNTSAGQIGCIIFRPSGISYTDGAEFTVTVTGLETPIQYTVSFFKLS